MKRPLTVLLCLCLAVVVLGTARAAEKNAPVKPGRSASAKPAASEVDSVALLEKAVARDSSRFDNLYRLGVMYLDHDKPKQAAQVLARAHRLRPKDNRVLVNLGVAYDSDGKADLAQKSYREALELAPRDSIASCRLANSLHAARNDSAAMAILTRIIRESPGAYCAYFTMGVAFADAGIYRDAIRMWQKVVDLAPTSPEAISARESMEVLERVLAAPSP